VANGNINVDIDKLSNFVTALDDLVASLNDSGFIPPHLVPGSGSRQPDVGQHVDGFKDADDLYNAYDTARRQILGDPGKPGGSFGDFVNELTLLSNVARQICQNYQKAQNEDLYSADMVNQALNPPATPQLPAATP
jgi:hypothetical protein